MSNLNPLLVKQAVVSPPPVFTYYFFVLHPGMAQESIIIKTGKSSDRIEEFWHEIDQEYPGVPAMLMCKINNRDGLISCNRKVNGSWEMVTHGN